MIHYSIQEWTGYFFVIEIDETQADAKAEIVYSGHDADDCYEWVHAQQEAAA